MKDYVAENERILEEWRKSLEIEDVCFALDGIMNKGEFYIDDYEAVRRKESGKENAMWNECPLRVLFLTKDENTQGCEAWDVRTETFYKKGCGLPPINKVVSGSFFYQNEACLLYGLLNTNLTENGMIKYDAFSWEYALSFSDENIFARINCKKEAGGPSILNTDLESAITKSSKYLKEQILNLDADIIVCCGSQNGKNIIIDAVYEIYKDEFKYVNCVEGKGTGMHYNAKRNKLAIDAYHLAYSLPKCKGSDPLEDRYYETIGMYYEFLKYLKETKDIDFSASHRR